MTAHGDYQFLSDPADAWTLMLPIVPGSRPADDETVVLRKPATDTLQIPANVDRWVELSEALTQAGVPPAVGDVAALRQIAKLDQVVADAVVRWVLVANRWTR
ncbi:hypothetical protein [Streptomyces sp. CB01881]|uniref:hypothetical protein n=1 Tax=Streptomyces sp. CB01881 TaxID=2078691 RepID=UPI000CDCCAF5|nr:hypothetical protein [Streptomyces sp. CB01881]AUY48317.1 hypothetical protein C2142_04330 [Streptomyces sp. CB01881]TYC76804.1 hypothetical protein EH183_04340 [Streptomyces sp. CB01881]